MKLRALVFEGDEVIRTTLRQILERRGYQVFTFSHPGLCPLHVAPECLSPPNHVCADIIISDVDMPHVNGLAFVESQLKKGCKIENIAIMSAGWYDSDFRLARNLGCHTLDKPFDFFKLTNWLEECEKKINPKRLLFDWFQKKDVALSETN